MVCWGPSTYGAIGNGVSSNDSSFPLSGGYNTPVTVLNDDDSTLQSVTAIDAGMDQTCVVLANTTAKCWGENFMGQIGNTDTSTRKLKAYPVMSEDGFGTFRDHRDQCRTVRLVRDDVHREREVLRGQLGRIAGQRPHRQQRNPRSTQ